MGAGGTLDGKGAVAEFIDDGGRVTRPTSLNILKVAPLSHATRHFMIPVLFGC